MLLTKGNHKAVSIHKGRWPNYLDPVEACFKEYTMQQSWANTPVPDREFCLVCFLTWKHIFKIWVVKLINEILDNTKSDNPCFPLVETSIVCIYAEFCSRKPRYLSGIINLLGTELIINRHPYSLSKHDRHCSYRGMAI